jgi:arylsulfatase A-like enzyme
MENAFANANSTLGSLASLFTSKYPTQTGVINPPDVLRGVDAYEHLPGFLSAAGYATVEIGVKKYVDATTMNVQNGFDVVNQRSIQNDPLVKAWRDAGYWLSAQLIDSLEEKLADRFLHAFYLDSIANPFRLVTQPVNWKDDIKRKDQLLSLLDQNKRPVFVHVQFMGTHGGQFVIEEPKYSRGQEQDKSWMVDFYDDSILAFDRYVGEIIEYLKTSGQYNNTVLIIYSDHPMHSDIRERIPLLLHFPGDQYAGRVSYNTQNLDIAPTILDYMGQDVPDWMAGRSLLSVNPGDDGLIFSTIKFGATLDENDQGQAEVSRGVAPFYRVKSLQVVACDHWYRLNLWTREWSSGLVDRHTAPCVESDLPSQAEIMQSIIEFLAGQGYDVSTLR